MYSIYAQKAHVIVFGSHQCCKSKSRFMHFIYFLEELFSRKATDKNDDASHFVITTFHFQLLDQKSVQDIIVSDYLKGSKGLKLIMYSFWAEIQKWSSLSATLSSYLLLYEDARIISRTFTCCVVIRGLLLNALVS